VVKSNPDIRSSRPLGPIVCEFARVDFVYKRVLTSVNRPTAHGPLYEATRYASKMNLKKAQHAEVILATKQGIIKGALFAFERQEATTENFPEREPVPRRFGFVGADAPAQLETFTSANECPTRTISLALRTQFDTPGAEGCSRLLGRALRTSNCTGNVFLRQRCGREPRRSGANNDNFEQRARSKSARSLVVVAWNPGVERATVCHIIR
jgi:hypothetical protein